MEHRLVRALLRQGRGPLLLLLLLLPPPPRPMLQGAEESQSCIQPPPLSIRALRHQSSDRVTVSVHNKHSRPTLQHFNRK